MPEPFQDLHQLSEVRQDVLRALVDIWRGARLIRGGVDVTDEHSAYLRAVVANIDARMAAISEASRGKLSQEQLVG